MELKGLSARIDAYPQMIQTPAWQGDSSWLGEHGGGGLCSQVLPLLHHC